MRTGVNVIISRGNSPAFWVLPVQRVRSAVCESGDVALELIEDSGVAEGEMKRYLSVR